LQNLDDAPVIYAASQESNRYTKGKGTSSDYLQNLDGPPPGFTGGGGNHVPHHL